jgi:hypothetical protein
MEKKHDKVVQKRKKAGGGTASLASRLRQQLLEGVVGDEQLVPYGVIRNLLNEQPIFLLCLGATAP